jgi:hypothetical protein
MRVSSKSQAPNPKRQTSTNNQAPSTKRFGYWAIGGWNLFGILDLVLGVSF